MRVLLLSGPNLSMLGRRDPALYGTTTLDELVVLARSAAEARGATLSHEQHDAEGDLVAAVHRAVRDASCDAIVINAGALTHYGLSLRDALDVATVPKVELHLSNTQAREDFRHVLVISGVCDGLIAGFGVHGYRLAVEAALVLAAER